MDQLISQLQQRISGLLLELAAAHEEIDRLRQTNATTDTSDSTYQQLSQINSPSTGDQLQLYIEDSLDLISVNHVATNNLEQEQEQEQTLTDLADNIKESHDNKKRHKNRKTNRKLIQLLEVRFPKAFNWNHPSPLKVGIDKDIPLDEELTASKLKRALAAYTRSDRYKKCLQAKKPRIDLMGRTNTTTAQPSVKPRPTEPGITEACLAEPAAEAAPTETTTPLADEKHVSGDDMKPAAASSVEMESSLSPDERMQQKLKNLLSLNKR